RARGHRHAPGSPCGARFRPAPRRRRVVGSDVSDHPVDPGAAGPAGHPPIPSRWRRRPGERMVMTPLMSSIGAMIAFAAVVFIVVLLPVQTFNPKASADWAPLSNAAL